MVGLSVPANQPAVAAAGINKTINFQGRLLNSAGAVIPDGNYNMKFRIYQDGNGLLPNNTGGSPAGTLKWTEEFKNFFTQGVVVKNGYFSVALGSYCAFSGSACTGGQSQSNTAISWDQDTLYLSMDVSTIGTDTINALTYNGELLPMRRLSSAVYAMNAGQLGGLTSAQFVQLGQNPSTAQVDGSTNASIYLNKTSTGNFIQLQKTAGVDVFTIDNTGNLVLGSNANKTISVSAAGSGATGKDLLLQSGAGGGGAASTAGGLLTLQGGNANSGTGSANGGDVRIVGGTLGGGGAAGNVTLAWNGTTAVGAVGIGKAANPGSYALDVAGAINSSTSVSATTSVISPSFTGTGAVTVSSGGAAALTLDSASNILVVAATDTTLRRSAAGAYTIDLLDSGANTTLAVTNSDGTQVANLTVEGGITAGSDISTSSNLIFSGAGNVARTIRKSMVVTTAVTANDVVIIDTVTAGQVTTTTSAGSNKVFGIATTTQAGTGVTQDIVTNGIFQVNATAATVAIGDFLVTTTTAGQVASSTTPAAGSVLGRALSAKGAGAGTVWVSLNAGSGGSGSGGGARLDQITAATGTATIASAANAVNWNWQFSGAGTGLSFGETVASTGGAQNQFILQSSTLAGSTASPLQVTSNGTGNIVYNLASTGDMVIQDNGTTSASFNDDGTLSLTNAGIATAGQTHLSLTTTFNPSGGGAQTGISQAITNSPTATANTATGESITINDATALANTLNGTKIVVSDTGSGQKIVAGVSVDISGTTNTSVLSKPAGVFVKTNNPAQAGYVSYGLRIQNSSSVDLFTVSNSGAVTIAATVLPGANAGADGLTVTGGTGTTSPTPGTGGIGIVTTGGVGGSGSPGSGVAGGDGLRATGGGGGAGSTANGGAGGAIKLTGGVGGVSSSSAGGAGGDVVIAGGAGGNTSGGANGNGGNITLQGGALGTGGTSGTAGSVTVKNATDSTTAFQIQKAASANRLFTVDSTNNEIELGMAGTGGINGKLVFNTTNASNFASTITVGATQAANFDYTLPLAVAATGDCLKAGTVAAPAIPLVFGSCGAGGTGLSRTAMDTGSAAALSSGTGVYIQLTNSSSAVASGVLKLDNANNTGAALLATATAGNLIDLQNTSTSKLKVDSAGLVTMTPTTLTNGQVALTQTINGANTTASGAVTGQQLGLTLVNTNTTTDKGIALTVTDNSSAIVSTNKGLEVVMSGSNASQTQIGVDASATKGIGVKGTSTNGSGTATIQVESASAVGIYGTNTGVGAASNTYYGVQGVSAPSGLAAYNSVGVFGSASVSSGGSTGYSGYFRANPTSAATSYGGYFTLASGYVGNAGALLQVQNQAPASTSFAGTNAIASVVVQGGTGGDTTGITSQTAGTGALTSITTGTGGAATGASGSEFGGTGGALTLATGNGGAGTASINSTGGAGGNIAITAGNGGAGSIAAGNGGTITLQAGSGQVAGSVTVKNAADSTTAFQVQNAAGTGLFTVDSLNGKVTISGSAITTSNGTTGVVIGTGYSAGDTTLTALTLDSTSTLAETASTCTASVNGGALYYNSNAGSNAIRACINGAWEDLISTAGLGILAFGVVPDSGAAAGDLVSITAAGAGPCKVIIGGTTATVSWTACVAYSGGRKVVVAAGTQVATNAVAGNYQHLCLNGTNSQPTLTASAAQNAGFPGFSAGAPVLCLADIKFAAGNNTITQIYDVRTFVTSTKTFANVVTTAPSLGMVVTNNTTTSGQYIISATTGGQVIGVVVASAGTTTANTMNAVIATAGPAYIKATAATVGALVQSVGTTTAGYVNTAAGAGVYATLGVAQSTNSAVCAINVDDCRGSVFTILSIR